MDVVWTHPHSLTVYTGSQYVFCYYIKQKYDRKFVVQGFEYKLRMPVRGYGMATETEGLEVH